MSAPFQEKVSTFDQVLARLGQIRAECDGLNKALQQWKELMASERVVDLALSTRQGGLVCLFVGRFLGEVHARLDLADTLSVPPAELQLQQIATIIGHLTQLTKDWVTCLTDSNLGQSTLDGLSGASRWLRGLSQPLASQVEQATKLVRSIPTLCSMYFDPDDYATFSSSGLPTVLDSLEAFLAQLSPEQLDTQPAGIVHLVMDHLAHVCCCAIMCLRQPRAFVGQPQSYATYASNLVYELDSLAGNSVVSLAASRPPPRSPS